ncbi:MAG: hypothetical protein JXA37_04105, partial [Chloroflexia bacterium]|nr:hypothetical protein [Chloroflexia bacterium]
SETMAMLTLNRGEFLAFSERMDRPVRVRIAPPQISPGVGQKQLLQSERGRELPSVSSASRASWTAIARILAARNEVRTAMRRSVLSLIAGGTPSSSESYEHLLTMIRHCSPSALPDQATEQALIRDTLRYAADELATSLGQFYGWSFQQEEQFLQDIANIVLPGQQIPTEQQIGAFHQSCRKLFLRQVLPYESCKHCHQPCLYRFFVKDLIAVENLDQWFREALERESQNPWADIGNTCLASLRGVIEAQPVQSLHGAAICYLLQKMHALNERALDIARAVEQVQLYFQDRLERLEEC